MSDYPTTMIPVRRRERQEVTNGFTIRGRGKFWEVFDPEGELVCITVYRCGAREVVRRVSVAETPAAIPAALPSLLQRIQAPNGLQDLGDALDELEALLRAEPAAWTWERSMGYEESCLAVLLARARFQVLALTAQHMLIRNNGHVERERVA